MSEEQAGQGFTLDDALKIAAGFDWISPVGQMAVQFLANGETLQVDLSGFSGRPIAICHYLDKRGVRCAFPMMLEEYLMFVVPKEKVGYACSLLRKEGLTVVNQPAPQPRGRRQPGLVPA